MYRWRHLWLGLCLLAALSWLQFLGAATLGAEVTAQQSIYVPLVVRTEQPAPPTDPGPEWLTLINQFRSQASLPLLGEEEYWSEGSWLHARYMVKNDVIQHHEDPVNPWYSTGGAEAAANCNLMVSTTGLVDDDYPILIWMQAPFHAVGLLDPALHSVGYGTYRESDGGFEMGAALDVLRGLGQIPETVRFPVAWPGDSAIVPLAYHWVESPDPLTSCPGYATPSGLPILLQLGSGGLTPDVTAHSLRRDGVDLPHCVFDETDYANPNDALRDLGRSVLGARDAVIIIPRDPLDPGATYEVSVTANGRTTAWSFTVAGTAPVPGSILRDGTGTEGGEPAAVVLPAGYGARLE
jgi:hypothetical protein